MKELAQVCRAQGHPGPVRRRARLRADRRRAVPGPLARGRDLGHRQHAQDLPRPAARRHRLRPRRGGRAKYWPAADRGVFPGSSSNHHLHTLPALLVAIREMKAARGRLRGADRRQRPGARARRWRTRASPVEAQATSATRRATRSPSTSRRYGGGVPVAQRLEANDIIVNYNLLPCDTDAAQPLRPAHRRAGDDPLRHEGGRDAAAGGADGRRDQGLRRQSRTSTSCAPPSPSCSTSKATFRLHRLRMIRLAV